MDTGADYYFTILLYVVTYVVAFRQLWYGPPVSGLMLACMFGLGINHFFSGMIMIVPEFRPQMAYHTIRGFELTGWCVAGFLLGATYLHRQICPRLYSDEAAAEPPVHPPQPPSGRVGLIVLFSGLLIGFVALPLLARVPTLSAMLGAGPALICTGFCLWWWQHHDGDPAKRWGVFLAAALIMPFVGVVLQGFVGLAAGMLVVVMSFAAAYHPNRRTVVVGTLIIIFLGMSLWPTYYKARSEIRRVVWGGTDIDTRVRVITDVFIREFGPFDPSNHEHLRAIDDRMNQNLFIGVVEENFIRGRVEPAYGESYSTAVLAMIPRVIWPDKPFRLGGNAEVSKYTGFTFDATTSVGVVMPLELYINFGEVGMLLGGMLIGIALRHADLRTGRALLRGDYSAFVVMHAAGQMISLQTNTAQMLPSWLAAYFGSKILMHFVIPLATKPERAAAGGFAAPGAADGVIGTTDPDATEESFRGGPETAVPTRDDPAFPTSP